MLKMSCSKSGNCNDDQRIWCKGYICENNTIVKDSSKRKLGDSCSYSTDCQSNMCEKLDCQHLEDIGIPQSICDNMGICTLKNTSISNCDDF